MFVTVKSQLIRVISTVIGEVTLLLPLYTGLEQVSVSKYLTTSPPPLPSHPVATSDWSVVLTLALWARQLAAGQHHVVHSDLGVENGIRLLHKHNLEIIVSLT